MPKECILVGYFCVLKYPKHPIIFLGKYPNYPKKTGLRLTLTVTVTIFRILRIFLVLCLEEY